MSKAYVTLLQMYDVSDNNGFSSNEATLRKELRQIWDDGTRILGVKCTEATGYTWDLSHLICKIWHEFGGLINHYHFGSAGGAAQGADQADFFWAHVRGDYEWCDYVTFDAERNGETGKETNAFVDRLRDHHKYKGRGFFYGGSYFLRDAGIRKYRGFRAWIAAFPNIPFIPPSWKVAMAHQFTETARVPGLHSNLDKSHLRKWVIYLPLDKGDKNFAVLHLARLLHRAGYKGFKMNMYMGKGKVKAVNEFRKSKGWPQSGHVGVRCWRALAVEAKKGHHK